MAMCNSCEELQAAYNLAFTGDTKCGIPAAGIVVQFACPKPNGYATLAIADKPENRPDAYMDAMVGDNPHQTHKFYFRAIDLPHFTLASGEIGLETSCKQFRTRIAENVWEYFEVLSINASSLMAGSCLLGLQVVAQRVHKPCGYPNYTGQSV